MKTYTVKERFRTVQGEGHHVGTPAIFIRLAGCNMWSGREQDRERDSQRNLAHCPRWCDTDFVGGSKMSAHDVETWLEEQPAVPLVVITGGEPMLQVDNDLLDAVWNGAPEARIAIETNGSFRPDWYPDRPEQATSKLWVTMSPKQPRSHIALPWANELKLVWPDYDPADWAGFPADHRFISPRADRTIRDEVVEQDAAVWVSEQFGWRLSLQTHKITRMR
jgi:7-carboxy-7-deazaguanine synthase